MLWFRGRIVIRRMKKRRKNDPVPSQGAHAERQIAGETQ